MKKFFPYIVFAFFNTPFFAASQNKISSVNAFKNPTDDTRLHTWSHLNGSTASLVNFAEDLQAINTPNDTIIIQ